MESDRIFAGPVPQLYDHYLGPILFQPFAAVIAEHLGEGDRAILETAAGTGIVTRAMAAALPGSSILATDLNQAMLDVAAERTVAANVTWCQADALDLPVAEGAFDVVVCGFGVMFMTDRPAAHRAARRALRPRGRLLFTVWDHIESNPLMHLAEAALAALFPHDPPCFFSRTPYGYHDRALIADDLRAAGFTAAAIDVVRRESPVASAAEAAKGICQGTPLRGEIEARDPAGSGPASAAVAAALRKRFGDGPFQTPLQALLVTAS